MGAINSTEAAQEALIILQPPGCNSSSSQGCVPDEFLTETSILGLSQLLDSYHGEGGALSRAAGIFTLANMLWCFGAIGVAIALFPALAFLAEPLRNVLWHLHCVLIPFYSGLAFTMCFYIIMASFRYSPDTAPYISLLGALIALAVCLILMARHASHASPYYLRHMPSLFGLLLFTPLAAAHQSALLGFGASGCFYAQLGFVILPLGLGWAAGWLNDRDMLQTSAAAGVLTLLLMATRAAKVFIPAVAGKGATAAHIRLGAGAVKGAASSGTAVQLLLHFERASRPFRPGLACFGSIALLLSGLIWSSRRYSGYRPWEHTAPADPSTGPDGSKGGVLHMLADPWVRYGLLNALYLGILSVMGGFGALLRDGMFLNTAATFAALWGGEKLVELVDVGRYLWLVLLAGSGALVWVAQFLKGHPDWVMSMVGAGELQ